MSLCVIIRFHVKKRMQTKHQSVMAQIFAGLRDFCPRLPVQHWENEKRPVSKPRTLKKYLFPSEWIIVIVYYQGVPITQCKPPAPFRAIPGGEREKESSAPSLGSGGRHPLYIQD